MDIVVVPKVETISWVKSEDGSLRGSKASHNGLESAIAHGATHFLADEINQRAGSQIAHGGTGLNGIPKGSVSISADNAQKFLRLYPGANIQAAASKNAAQTASGAAASLPANVAKQAMKLAQSTGVAAVGRDAVVKHLPNPSGGKDNPKGQGPGPSKAR